MTTARPNLQLESIVDTIRSAVSKGQKKTLVSALDEFENFLLGIAEAPQEYVEAVSEILLVEGFQARAELAAFLMNVYIERGKVSYDGLQSIAQSAARASCGNVNEIAALAIGDFIARSLCINDSLCLLSAMALNGTTCEALKGVEIGLDIVGRTPLDTEAKQKLRDTRAILDRRYSSCA